MADDAVIGYVMEKVIMADSLIGHSSFSLSLYKMRLYFMVSQKDGFPIPWCGQIYTLIIYQMI